MMVVCSGSAALLNLDEGSIVAWGIARLYLYDFRQWLLLNLLTIDSAPSVIW
jgi:hypothetical protein